MAHSMLYLLKDLDLGVHHRQVLDIIQTWPGSMWAWPIWAQPHIWAQVQHLGRVPFGPGSHLGLGHI